MSDTQASIAGQAGKSALKALNPNATHAQDNTRPTNISKAGSAHNKWIDQVVQPDCEYAVLVAQRLG